MRKPEWARARGRLWLAGSLLLCRVPAARADEPRAQPLDATPAAPPDAEVEPAAAPAPVEDRTALTKADLLFRLGKEHLAAEAYPQACAMFAESYRLDAATGSLLALALCHERAGQRASAHARYREAAARAREQQDRARAEAAEARAEALAPQLSRLTIVLTAEDAGTATVRINQALLAPAQHGVPVPVDGGPVTVEASADGKLGWKQTLEVPERAAALRLAVPPLQPVSIAAAEPPPVTLAGLAPASERSRMRVASLALTGAAGAALVVSGLATLRWYIRDRTADIGCEDGPCTEDAISDREAAHLTGQVAARAAGVSVVVGTAALVTYLLDRRGRRTETRRALRVSAWLARSELGAVARVSF